jgi:hypothetical protein
MPGSTLLRIRTPRPHWVVETFDGSSREARFRKVTTIDFERTLQVMV